MSNSPLFTKLDADRILQRAAEIEGSDPERAMSVTEIRGIAGEAGFGFNAVERAIAETFAPYLNARDWVSINRGVEVGFSKDGFEAVGPADRERS